MNVSRYVWLACAALLVGSAVFYATRPVPASLSETDVASAVPGLAVRVLEVARQAAVDEVALACTVAPRRRVQIAAEVDGQVVEVAVEEHSHVLQGDVLVRLERRLLEAAVARSEASVLRARAAHDLAELELKRQKGLRAKNVGSESELDRAQSEARGRLGELREAEAQLADARTRLEKSEIRAPFAGFVSDLDLDPGAFLRAGTEVAELIDLSTVEVEVGVTDRQVVGLSEGAPARLSVDVFPEETFEGTVTSIGRSLDDAQKFPVVVRFPNTDERLLPGMLGRLRLQLGSAGEVIRIPRMASVREFELDYVFVIGSDGRAERRRVKARPVPFRPDLLEVVSGLDEGERVITSRIRELSEGVQVREAL